MLAAQMIYRTTRSFPSEERFGLTNQMRRCAVSIPCNIAEGHARSGPAEFRHFISIAMGSVAELETQVILSANLGYLEETDQQELLNILMDIGKMLRGLDKSLISRIKHKPSD
ncbi:MAG: four helix bundle protein [Roseiflexaceae bacterium]